MQAHEYKHTLKIDEDARYLRFICWLWGMNKYDVDICKLFWATVFCVPFLFIRIIIIEPCKWAATPIYNWYYIKKVQKVRVRPVKPPKQEKPKEEKEHLFLNRIANFAAWLSMKIKQIYWWFSRRKLLLRALTILFFGLGGLASLFILAGSIYIIATNPEIGYGILLGLFGLAFIIGLISMLVIFKVGHKIKIYLLKPTGGFFKSTFQTLYYGGKAIKAGTCPRIEIVKDDENKEGDAIATGY